MPHLTHQTGAACLALTALLTWPAQAADIEFKAVAPGVYAFIGEIDGRSYENEALNANIGLVVTPAGAVLIDSGASFNGARQIAEAARKVSPQEIKWVINTGGQDHRWLGNGYFKSHGAEIMAHEDAQADMKARALAHLATLKPVLKEKLAGTEPVYPTSWLKDSDSRWTFGGVVFEIKHRQGGHTPGDSIVWLPQSNVLFSGDVVYVDRILGLHPVSNTKNWLASFAMIEELKPQTIVPGHGRVTNLPTAQAQTRDVLVALRTQCTKAVKVGMDISAAVKGFDATPFKSLKHVEVWMPQLVNFTYLEIERE